MKLGPHANNHVSEPSYEQTLWPKLSPQVTIALAAILISTSGEALSQNYPAVSEFLTH